VNTSGDAFATSRAAGSLRDPSGYVFIRDGQVFRAVDQASFQSLQRLMTLPLWQSLQSGRRIVATEVVAANQAPAPWPEMDQRPYVLTHEHIAHISYPYEWSISMLADAGRLTLELQLALLNEGFGLKDASAYNVQFVKGRPIFIDVASIEEPSRRDIWFALGQFQRMFTYPLLLKRYRGWDLKSYFQGHPDGMSESRMAAASGMCRWRPGMLLDVALPALAQARALRQEQAALQWGARRSDASGQVVNLNRLSRKLASLAGSDRLSGEWARYAPVLSYQGEQEAKRDVVARWLRDIRPKQVLDIGSNTGEYSFLAAHTGAAVIALDGDPDAVELLYRRLQQEPAAITPLVADIVSPSPATGFMNEEHQALGARARSDCVLALAVLHHLVVRAALPLVAIRDLLWEYTTQWVILEVVPEADPMFKNLMRLRRPLSDVITLDSVIEAFEPRFSRAATEPVGASGRHLLLLRRK
jgi:SAM-dependent methyltransferase